MPHSIYQISSPNQPKELKSAQRQSKHPSSHLDRTVFYTGYTNYIAIDYSSSLDILGLIHLHVHLRCYWVKAEEEAVSEDNLSPPLPYLLTLCSCVC